MVRSQTMSASDRTSARDEVAIVGAGCAGLALARALAGTGRPPVVLIDPSPGALSRRTWSFWTRAPRTWRHQSIGVWPYWRVVGPDGSQRVHGGSHVYCAVDSDLYVAQHLEEIQRAENITVIRGRVDDIARGTGDRVTMTGTAGELSVGRVFDSRPPPVPQDGGLLQHFAGWRVETERPVFTPDCMTLMDFSRARAEEPHFVYVLPFSETQALVEPTFLSPVPHAAGVYERACRDYLDRLGAGGVHLTPAERGILPMQARPSIPSDIPGHHAIGLAGGTVRASSGYGFLAIQRLTREIALRLDTRTPGFRMPTARAARLDWMDALFLEVLRRNPARIPTLFYGLLTRCPPDRLVGFLQDDPRLRTLLSVALAMPHWDSFMHALGPAIGRRLRLS